ncbi:MAG: DUF935 family protein [Pseudomonadota bacterium]
MKRQTMLDRLKQILQKPALRRRISEPDAPLPATAWQTRFSERQITNLLASAEAGNTTDWFQFQARMLQGWPHFAAISASRARSVERMAFSLASGGSSKADFKAVDLVRESLLQNDLLQSALPHLLTAQRLGFAASEIVWEADEKTWLPVALTPIAHQRIGFSGNSFGLYMPGSARTSPFAPGKVVMFRPFVTSNPQPVMDGFGWPLAHFWLYSDFGLKAWGSFIEKFSKPLMLGKYHRGASTDDKSVLKKAITNMGRNAAAIIPEEMLIEFVETGLRPGAYHEPMLRYLDRAASKLVLGQDSTTEAISGGHAVSREHNELRIEIVQADADALASCLGNQLLHWLVQLNIPEASTPRLIIAPPKAFDMNEYRANLGVAQQAGLPVSKIQFYELTGIHPPAEASDVL